MFLSWPGSFVLVGNARRLRPARHFLEQGAARRTQPSASPTNVEPDFRFRRKIEIAHHALEVAARGREKPRGVGLKCVSTLLKRWGPRPDASHRVCKTSKQPGSTQRKSIGAAKQP